MIRKLLATTAVAAVCVTSAVAQTVPTPADAGNSIFSRDTSVDMSMQFDGYFEADSTEILATSLLGKPVFNSSADDADRIGDVNDVLMSSDGTAKAVVVGVGGFVGIGEKEVAVDFSRVTWNENNGEYRLVLATSADELNAAPAFDRSGIGPDHNMAMTDPTNGMKISDKPANGVVGNDYTMVDYTTLTVDDVLGARVHDANGDDIGEISDALLSDDGATINAYVVDVGGFLGIGEKPVALAADALEVSRDANGALRVHTSFTQDQLNNETTYSEDAYAKTPDLVLVR